MLHGTDKFDQLSGQDSLCQAAWQWHCIDGLQSLRIKYVHSCIIETSILYTLSDLEKTNSMILRQTFRFFLHLDSWMCKLELTSEMSSSYPVNDAKYVNTI